MPANPIYEPYMARRASIPDGRTPAGLDVIIVANEDRKALLSIHRKAIAQGVHTTAITVEEDPGPWNTVFNSIPFFLTIYGLFTIVRLTSIYYIVKICVRIVALFCLLCTGSF